MGMRENLLLLFIPVLIFFLGFPNVYAQSAEISFFPDSIVKQHRYVFTLNDPSAANNGTPFETTTVLLTSDANPVGITPTLVEIGDTGVFSSGQIKFLIQNSHEHTRLKINNFDTVIATWTEDQSVNTSIRVYPNDPNALSDPKFNVNLKIHTNHATCINDNEPNGINQPSGDGICDEWENFANNTGLKINHPYAKHDDIPYFFMCDRSIPKDCPTPNQRDVFVEIDWIKGHKPSPFALDELKKAFDKEGMVLHFDLDEEVINHTNTIPFEGTDTEPGFNQIKRNFAGSEEERENEDWTWPTRAWKQKKQVFHYALFVHAIETPGETNPTGKAEIKGNDLIISLGASVWGKVGSSDQQAGTFMHELGHNFGYHHGGPWSDQTNCKPNYISVMSYSRQFSDLISDRELSYSNKTIGQGLDPYDPPIPLSETSPGNMPLTRYGTGPITTVYGDNNGALFYTTTEAGSTDWHGPNVDLTFIKDSKGNIVCDSDGTMGLVGHDDWGNWHSSTSLQYTF